MAVRVVTDSLADVPPAMADALGVSVVPVTVSFGLESFRDGIDITSAQFFDRLASDKIFPKTSQPSVGAFSEVYDALAAQGHDIVSVHASGKLSGTVNSAALAAREVSGVGVEVVDTMSASLGEGLVVLAAARLAQAGASLQEVASAASEAVSKVEVYFLLDTLEYLQKGGRIGRAQALLGSLLSIKPILTVVEGEVHPFERVRTRAKAVARLKAVVTAKGPYAELAVIHATTPGEMEDLASALAPLALDRSVVTSTIGSTIGAYTGPGILGVATLKA